MTKIIRKTGTGFTRILARFGKGERPAYRWYEVEVACF
jgi:hypothetical protein